MASPAEQARLAELAAADSRVHWDRLLFSAKESVYKAWFPLTGQWLGFDGAAIDFDPKNGQFTARILLDDPPIKGFEGRWRVEDGLLATAIVVPA